MIINFKIRNEPYKTPDSPSIDNIKINNNKYIIFKNLLKLINIYSISFDNF